MKAILMGAAALSLLAAPAFAQSAGASSTVNINGSVANACGTGNHISGAAVNPAWTQGDITLASMVDAEGQFNGASFANRSFGNMWCNGPATVSLTVLPLTTSGSAQDGGSFANTFDLRVTTNTSVYWNNNTPGGIVETNGAAAAASGSVNHAFETGLGQYSGFTVEILPEIGSGGNNKRPVAGTYSAAITLSASKS